MLTCENWQDDALPDFSIDKDTKGANEVIEWAFKTYGDKIVYACSFGIEGMVLIELIHRIAPNAKIVFLDTHYHFQETYDLISKVKKRYPSLDIHMQQPDLSIEEQAEKHGKDLFKTNPDKCCELRKIIPLNKAIEGYVAWISGLRREQSPFRQNTNFLNQDKKFQKVKVCPLIHWTWKDVWRFVTKYKLDYNELHDRGYPSIGCAPCTRPEFTADDLRSGRWSGQGKTECGLHTP